jgi:sugar transferase (PEP-CTERM/EpsH1 system associated)
VHILWLKTELLHPIDKGGKIRTYHLLRGLRRRHRVTYLTLDDGRAAPDAEALAREYCDALIRVPFDPPAKGSASFRADLARNLFSPLPYALARYRSDAMRRGIRAALDDGAVDLLLCDFLTPSVNVPDPIGVPSVLFQHNVEAAIWERRTRVARHPVERWYMREQWRRMRAFERAACRRFSHVLAVSAADEETFRSHYGAPSVSVVETGVDADFFRPGAPAPPSAELVFTGSMDWMPNEDGITWFVADILPLVRSAVPDVRLTVVGRSPPPAVRALAGRDSAITVTGTVPDVRPYLERASVFVVPLRVGGGTRLKIYEAMAMERPVVSTRIGAEGLPVRDGEELLLADEPGAFAQAVIRLLQDRHAACVLARRAAERVRREFSWEHVSGELATFLEGRV